MRIIFRFCACWYILLVWASAKLGAHQEAASDSTQSFARFGRGETVRGPVSRFEVVTAFFTIGAQI